MLDFQSNSTSNEMIDLSKTRKCVIYARCSTLMQKDSIESQISFCEAFAKQQGISVVGYFRDDGKTGRNAEREGLKALMEELQNPQKEWDLVLVYRLDRFFRNARLFIEHQYKMRDFSAYLLSAQESMLNNVFPMTETFRFFVAQQAELESHRIGENVARGKLTSAKNGSWQGGTAAYGYYIVDGALTINPKEKHAVELIFQQRANGMSLQKIADSVNEKGFTTKLNRPFKTTGIREILTNPCYKGELHYNRSSAKGANGFNRHRYKDDSQIVKIPCPAIVSAELWERVQPSSENKTRSSKSTRYLLSGKVFCKHCQSVMHANRRNNHEKLYIGFYCPSSKSHSGCTVKEIDMFRLEEFVLSCLCEELLSEKLLKQFANEFPTLNQKKKAELEELKAQQNRLEKRCKNLIDELEKNCSEDGSKEILERINKIAKEKAEIENSIAELSKTMTYAPTESDVTKARELFVSYCKQPENRPFVENLIRNNVERIEVGEKSIELSFCC